MLSAPGNVEQIAADDRRVFEEILSENDAENRRIADERQESASFYKTFSLFCLRLFIKILSGKNFQKESRKIEVESN